MKTISHVLACLTLITTAHTGLAALAIPSDGSDGALEITANTTIDLSQAVTGAWDANNGANAGKGIYDASKWAVVFKYSSVTIQAGATLTFANHPSRAPVVWLVSGDVTIAGKISVDGKAGTSTAPLRFEPTQPGPGGFRGGVSADGGLVQGTGFGLGGAWNDNGQYGPGQARSYGNGRIVPLLGGSGGSGNGNSAGGSGGGAILIAASGRITVSGGASVTANGGIVGSGPSGSGGGIRLVADEIVGSGFISATGGNAGRIRLEGNSVSTSLISNPAAPAGIPEPLVIWPPASAATARIISISGAAVPEDPRADLTTSSDVQVASTSPVTILIETKNFPPSGTVNLYVKPRHGLQTTYPAILVSGDAATAVWKVEKAVPVGYCTLQARAIAQ